MSSTVQFGLRKLLLAQMVLPFTGLRPLRVCGQQHRIDEVLKVYFNSIFARNDFQGSYLCNALQWSLLSADEEKETCLERIGISINNVTLGKFFKEVKDTGMANPCEMLDPVRLTAFADMLERKIKDHATLVLWNSISKGIIGAPQLTTAGDIRKWMSDANNAFLLQSVSCIIIKDVGLRTIPEEIKWLPNLELIDLSNNKIKAIPTKFECGSKLLWLYLNDNLILSIPRRIDGLSNLQRLSLDNNLIQFCPKKIEGLSNLIWLSVNNNRLNFIEIEGMPKLKMIEHENNPVVPRCKRGGCQIV